MFITFHKDHNGYYKYNSFEGVGATYQRIVALLAISKKHNLNYIHTLAKVGHNYNNDPEWHEKWDKMFNIMKITNNNYDTNLSKLENKYFTDISHKDIEKNLNETNNLYHYFNPYEIFDKNPDYYLSNIQEELINAYDENNNSRKLIYDKNKTSIAIHIRVYNDYDSSENYENCKNNKSIRHYMTSEKYINLINNLKDKYPNSDIHIFSQEKYFDLCYKKLRDVNNLIFHFNDLDTFDTFHHLCKADVLCMATSSLSILAAFYNKNIIIYLPYCHPPSLNKWIKYEP